MIINPQIDWSGICVLYYSIAIFQWSKISYSPSSLPLNLDLNPLCSHPHIRSLSASTENSLFSSALLLRVDFCHNPHGTMVSKQPPILRALPWCRLLTSRKYIFIRKNRINSVLRSTWLYRHRLKCLLCVPTRWSGVTTHRVSSAMSATRLFVASVARKIHRSKIRKKLRPEILIRTPLSLCFRNVQQWVSWRMNIKQWAAALTLSFCIS